MISIAVVHIVTAAFLPAVFGVFAHGAFPAFGGSLADWVFRVNARTTLDYPQTAKRLARRPRAERSRKCLSTLASPPVGVFRRGGYSARIIWHGSSGSLSGPSRPFHLPWREKSVRRPSAMA